MRFSSFYLGFLALPVVLLAQPRTAAACGGTFCDTGPNAMPVPQTGENILFVVEGTSVEAHILIQYDPETTADKFAWVIPLQTLPTFAVGSQLLFDNLLAGTVPTYGFNTQFDQCGVDDGGSATGGASTAGSTGSSSGGGDEGGDTGGPDVVFQDTVGAFEVVVLQGGTADEVMTWLGDNGYQQDPASEPILAEYLAENYLFAAFKLTTGVGLDSIHPVVLQFQGAEACVPLRLTRIAASEDMEVRSFFLGGARMVPRNYRHVVVNPLKLDWTTYASNYKDVITQAVDAEQADGKAFVTEYAGPSNVVAQGNLWSVAWDPAAFSTIMPIDVVDTLEGQGILYCEDGTNYCEFYHPLIEGLLRQYLPPPNGVEPYLFWSCLSCYQDMIDTMVWDAVAFSGAYQERVVDPGSHAVDLLQSWDYLTRMYTTISPGEMTEDPFFQENPDLEEVPNLRMATQRVLCNADNVWILPDGREVYVPQGAAWPEFPDEMPWEEDVERIATRGGPENLVDNTPRIDELLLAYNASHDWPSGAGTDGEGSGGTGESSAGTASAGTASAGSAESGSGTDGAGQDESSTSCACRGTTAPAPLHAALSLFGLGLVRARRRRGRSPG